MVLEKARLQDIVDNLEKEDKAGYHTNINNWHHFLKVISNAQKSWLNFVFEKIFLIPINNKIMVFCKIVLLLPTCFDRQRIFLLIQLSKNMIRAKVIKLD